MARLRPIPAAAIAVLCAAAGSLAPQAATRSPAWDAMPPIDPPQTQPTFRAAVEFVSVDVVVTDGRDRPVTDLTRDDFEILDDGRPQTLSTFQFVSIPVERREIDSAIDRPAVRPPPADVASNAPPRPGSRLFVLVIDDRHIIEAEIVPVKRLVADFLAALTPDDLVAITFVGRSDLGQSFTTDLGLLQRAIDRIREALAFGLDAMPPNERTRQDLHHARSSAFVLQNVARTLADAPQSRKAIVFVSGGSTIDPNASPAPYGRTSPAPPGPRLTTPGDEPESSPDEYLWARAMRDEMNRAYELAQRSGVAIYTVDPRGQATLDTAVRGGPPINELLAQEIRRRIRIQQDHLAEVAVNTGGRAFINRSDLTGAVRELVADNGSYYLLGYYPSPFAADGKYRRIAVRVKRDGLRVRGRDGYVATNPTTRPTDLDTRLKTALGSALPTGDLAIRAFAAPLRAAGSRMTTAVTIEAAYPAHAAASGRLDEQLSIAIVAIDQEGRIKASARHDTRFTLRPDSTGALRIAINDAIDLPAGTLTLRVALGSQALGSTSTVHVPVAVGRPDDDELQMSPVVLGFFGDPGLPIGRATALSGLVPFQPTTARTFDLGRDLRLFATLRWKGRDSTARVTASVRDAGTSTGPLSSPASGTPAGAGPPPLIDVTLVAAGSGVAQEATFDHRLPLGILPPGAYEVAITAVTEGRRPVTRTIPFLRR